MQSYCACIPLRSGIPHHQWTQCISALSLSHQPASQLYPSSHLLRVSSLFNTLAVLYLELRLCFNPQTAQALSQVSDRSGRVSSLRSCFDFKPRFAALRSIMRQLEEWDVYRESSASCILVIRSVTYEISYIQPIHWWDFRFTFWQVIESGKLLLAHELCPRILLSLNLLLTFDIRPPTCDLWLNFRSDLWPLTSGLWPLTSDLWPLIYGRCPATSDSTSESTYKTTSDLWPTAADLRPLTSDLWPGPAISDHLCLTLNLALNQPLFSKNLLFYLIFIMTGTGNGSRDKYKFKKLQGSHNYNQWTRDMSFAL